MTTRLNTCRFCGLTNYDKTDFDLIHYGVRHYAHPDCALKKHGAAFFERLKLWQLEREFPALAADRLGLLKALTDRIDLLKMEEEASRLSRINSYTGPPTYPDADGKLIYD